MIINHIFSIFFPSMYITHSPSYSFFFFFSFLCAFLNATERGQGIWITNYTSKHYVKEQNSQALSVPRHQGWVCLTIRSCKPPVPAPKHTHTHTHTHLIHKHLCCSISLKLCMLKTCFSLIVFFLPQMSQRYGDKVRNKGRV